MSKNNTSDTKLKIIFLGSFAFLAIIWALVPESVVFKSAPVCIHYRIFGLQCPFCGLSRAGYCLLHLRLAEAWLYNPLIFFIAWLYTLELATFFHLKYIPVVRKTSWWVGLGLVVIIYVIRLAS
jgi:hypothetical protein